MSKCSFFTALFLIIFQAQINAQCACGNCPQNLPDLVDLEFNVEVFGASNQILGQNGQGLCGVQINFRHDYIGDLQLSLTSPSGQTIQLIGPPGIFDGTNFTEWDITFLPCSAVASPDNNINSQFNNGEPWGILGNYTGSYYPFLGCFDTLSGNVNGLWTLHVLDNQMNDNGTLVDFTLIFCDPTNLECLPCDAAAGNLLQPDRISCLADSNLIFNLPPTYSPGQNPPPPAADYMYKYVVSGAGGNLLAYQNSPNLIAQPVGNYTVCGLSFRNDELPNLPAPGSITLADLIAQLGSATPPFCGDLTDNCVNVKINPPPADSIRFDTICGTDCLIFLGNTFCTAGNFNLKFQQNGCTRKAVLNLAAFPDRTKIFQDTVCAGNCSTIPGFPNACATGGYSQKFNLPGCDSIVILNLVVLKPIAKIKVPDTLKCGDNSVVLRALGAPPGSSFQWKAVSGGANISGATNLVTASATASGVYRLINCLGNPGGVLCCDSAEITVIDQRLPLPVPTGLTGDTLVCANDNLTFTLQNLVPGATTYTWSTPLDAQVLPGSIPTILNVKWGSSDGQICVFGENACAASPTICLNVKVQPSPVLSNISGVDTACHNQIINFSATVQPPSDVQWSVPAGMTIVSGQGTTNISVQTGAVSTGGQVCAWAIGECSSGTQICNSLTILGSTASPTISGNANGCGGDTLVFSTPEIPAPAFYTWSATGGNIIAGQGTNQVFFEISPGATVASVCLFVDNLCGSSPQTCQNITLGQPPAAPVISGTSEICAGENVGFSIADVPGANSYFWSIPPGASIVSGQNTKNLLVNFPNSPGGNVCVAATGNCGTGQNGCFSIVVHPIPTANAGLNDSVCGLNFNLAAVPSLPGSTGVWSQKGGSGTSVFSNQNSNSTGVSVSTAGNFEFQWIENANGCRDTASVFVQFLQPPTVQNPLENCDATNQFYSVSFSVLGGTSPFSATGGSFSGNIFTSDPISSGTNYNFQVTDAAGCFSAPILGTKSCDCATDAGTMDLTLQSVCENVEVQAVANPDFQMDADDIFEFVLHTNPGASLGTVLDRNATGQFIFNQNWQFNTIYYISRVVGTDFNGSPDPLDNCFSVAAGQPVIFRHVPKVDGGPDQTICGLEILMPVFVDTGATVFLNNPGLSFSAIQNFQVTATASVPGSFLVTLVAENFGCTAADTFNLTFFPPLVFTVPSIDCDAAGQNFTVKFMMTGGTMPFSVASGGSFSGNNFTSDLFPSGSVFLFEVSDAGGCTAEISGEYECQCVTSAGEMSATPIGVCGNDTAAASIAVQPFLDLNDIAVFVLHDQPGAVLGNVFATNSTGSFSFQNGMVFGQTYFISMVVGDSLAGQPNPNDPCLKISAGQPVVFSENPTANAGVDFSVCGNEANFQATATNFSGSWFQISGPGAATFDPNLMDGKISVLQSGDYIFKWEIQTPQNCRAADTVKITFFPQGSQVASIHACDNFNFSFTEKVIFSGGTQPYFVNGLPFVGDTFISQPMVNGSSFNFVFEDANGCSLGILSGTANCNCLTNAGTMAGQPISICGNGEITAQHLGNAKLDANDILTFILHDGTATTVGQIISENISGQFSFQNGMNFGQTYFVAAVAANNLNGFSDPNDPCRSVSAGQAVEWIRPAVAGATLVANQFCEDGGVFIELENVVAIVDTGGVWTEISPVLSQFFNPTAATVDLTHEKSGIYTYIYVVSGESPCPSDTSEVRFEIFSKPLADAGEDDTLDCNHSSAALGGLATSTGSQFSYSWYLDGLNFSTEKNPTATDAGIYRLDVLDTLYGCLGSDLVQIFEGGDLPTAEIFTKNGDCGAVAASGEIRVENISGGQPPYLISINGGSASSQTVFQNLPAGNYSIEIEDAAGCGWSSGNLTVASPEEILVVLEPEILVHQGDSVHLAAQISIDAGSIDTIFWSPLLDTAGVGTAFQNFQVESSKILEITVLDTNGCRGSAKVLIKVEQQVLIFVPNIFAPGSENGNDLVSVFGGDGILEIESFEIYDRWGERIFGSYHFQPNDQSKGWDGKFKGKKSLQGVYVWWLRVKLTDGRVEILKGDLTLKG